MAKRKKKKAKEESIWYNGMVGFKKTGVDISQHLTPERIRELQGCAFDCHYFIENYCKIKTVDPHPETGSRINPFILRDYQKEQVDLYLNHRFVALSYPRQSGKTAGTVAYFAWRLMFTSNFTIMCLANKDSVATDILKKVRLIIEELPIWMSEGIQNMNQHEINFENGSSIVAKATTLDAGRSASANIVYIDEAAFISRNTWLEFYKGVYPTISAGETSQVIMTSTPNGLNHWWNIYRDSIKVDENGDFINHEGDIDDVDTFILKEIKWDQVPIGFKGRYRDEAYRKKTIAKLGQAAWDSEYECIGKDSIINIYDEYEDRYFKITIGDMFEMMRREKDCENLKKTQTKEALQKKQESIRLREENYKLRTQEIINNKDFYTINDIRNMLFTEKYFYKKYEGKAGSLRLKNDNLKLYVSIMRILDDVSMPTFNFSAGISFILKHKGNIDNIRCKNCGIICKWDANNKYFRDYCIKCAPKYPSKEYFQWKYSENWEQEYNKTRQKRIKESTGRLSLKWFMEKYGDEGKRKYQEHWEYNFNKRSKIPYSKISQELFWSIYNKLTDDEKKTYIRFQELNGEHRINFNKNDKEIIGKERVTMFLDFVFHNKVIEFDGDYWHSETHKQDKKRDIIVKNKGYEILRIKESEYKSNNEKIIDMCLQFIRGNNNVL